MFKFSSQIDEDKIKHTEMKTLLYTYWLILHFISILFSEIKWPNAVACDFFPGCLPFNKLISDISFSEMEITY